MRSKTSWYNHELTKQNFRQVGWVSLVYFILLVFGIILNIIMQLGDEEQGYMFGYSNNLFDYGPLLQLASMFIVPVMLATLLLRFLHQKEASDFIHSLPLKRAKIFFHQIIFGFCSMLIPVILIGLILAIMHFSLDVSEFYTLSTLGYWLKMTSLMLAVVFVVSVFVGLLTGISVIQGIFTYIFLLLPAGLTMLMLINMNFILIGFPGDYYVNEKVLEMSPLTDVVPLIAHQDAEVFKIVIYLIVIVSLLGISVVLYRYRNVESVAQAVSINLLRPIFIYSFTFSMTLVGGFYYGSVQQDYNWIIFGYVTFSLIGYLIAQMVIQKTWRVFRRWKEYLVFLIGCAVLFLLISLDFSGFENRIPATDKIDHVYVLENSYSPYFVIDYIDGNGFTNKQEVEAIRDLHQVMIEDASRSDFLAYENDYIMFQYHLSNGKKVVREYYIRFTEEHHEQLVPIVQSPIYKKYTNDILNINDSSAVNRIDMRGETKPRSVTLSNQTDIRLAIEALQKDVLQESYAEMRYPLMELAYLEIEMDDQYIYVPIRPSHTNFLAWLASENLEEEVLIMPKHISGILVAKVDDWDTFYYDDDDVDWEDSLVIEDKSEIEQIINSIGEVRQEVDETYFIAIEFDSIDYKMTYRVDARLLPEFVTAYFNK